MTGGDRFSTYTGPLRVLMGPAAPGGAVMVGLLLPAAVSGAEKRGVPGSGRRARALRGGGGVDLRGSSCVMATAC